MRSRAVVAALAAAFMLALPGIGRAQAWVNVRGTIISVNCKALTLVLNSRGGPNTLTTGSYTAVLVDGVSIRLCALRRYIGAPATAWLVATGSTFTTTRIDVAVSAAAAPPYPYDGPYYGPSFWFGIGIGFGPGFHRHW